MKVHVYVGVNESTCFNIGCSWLHEHGNDSDKRKTTQKLCVDLI